MFHLFPFFSILSKNDNDSFLVVFKNIEYKTTAVTQFIVGKKPTSNTIFKMRDRHAFVLQLWYFWNQLRVTLYLNRRHRRYDNIVLQDT